MAVGVESQVAHHQVGAPSRGAAAQQRAHAGQQLLALEGLDQIVVGPGVEPRHARLERVARGEDEDGHVALLAQPAADLHAVELGQAQVEHDRVGLEVVRLVERGLTVARDADLVALLVEGTAEHAGDIGVVLDNQHPGSSAHPASW